MIIWSDSRSLDLCKVIKNIFRLGYREYFNPFLSYSNNGFTKYISSLHRPNKYVVRVW